MQKILIPKSKSLIRVLTGGGEILILILVSLISSFGLVFGFAGSAFASDNIDTNVNIKPSLTLSVSANTLNLNLDPSSVTFGYNDLDVTVGTNNETGYVLTMSTTSTDLVNTEDNNVVIETLPALSGGYTDSTFITNKWGYKKNRNTDNYNNFPLTETLLENSTKTNEDVANLRFATKIDYLQESGTYTTAISFNAVANPLVFYMQDFTATDKNAMVVGAVKTLTDNRDEQEYVVRKFQDNNVWMIENLAIGCNGGNRITRNLTIANSNLSSSWSTSSASSLASNTGSASTPRMLCDADYGGYYNLTATSGGTVISSSTNLAYDICPLGWRLPTYSELSALISSLGSDLSDFNPIAAGYYNDSGKNEFIGTRGFYWSSSYYNSSYTYFLRYRTDDNTLTLDGSGRWAGNQVRCIAK